MQISDQHETQSGNKVRPLQKWGWAVGGLADNFIGTGVLYLGMLIFNLGLGLSAALVGYVLAAPRIVDAIVDPLIGNMSDNTRSRWGRRRPFILVGGLIAAVFYVLTWSPPSGLEAQAAHWWQNGLFWYFLLMTMLCFVGYAIFVIPHNALGLEMTTDYHERTQVQSAKYLFLIIAQLLSSWLYKASLTFGHWAGVPAGEKAEVIGVRYVALIVAGVIIVSSALPAFLCREQVPTQSHEKVKIFSAIRLTLSHKPFILLCVMFLAVVIGLNLITPVGTYVSIFHACGGDKELGSEIGAWGGTLFGVLGFLAAWPVSWVARRLGKRKAIMAGLGIAMVGALSTWPCYTPDHPWLQLVSWSIMCTGLSCLWILTPSMLADVIDYDELKCGFKRAGVFGAVFALISKGGVALAAVVSGLMLGWVGFDQKVTVQDPQTILWMRLTFALVPASLMGVGIMMAYFFPITEEKVHEVRKQIEERK